jgi:hypothetical protein
MAEETKSPTFTVEIEGKAHEIPIPKGYISEKEIGDKFVPKAAHNDQLARMRQQLDGIKNHRDPDELLKDPEFKTKAVTEWGLDPSKTNEQFQRQLERTKTDLLEREVKPREVKLEKLKGTVEQLRIKDLQGQIIRAAASAKVDDMFLKGAVKNGTPLIVSMLRDAFAFDDENGEWFAKGQTSPFAYSQSGTTPYQTVDEFINLWAGTEGKGFIRNERQPGADTNTTSNEGAGMVGKEIRVTEAQMRDITSFKRLQERALKEGLTIVPIP